ncbi:major facilitator superfamily domain-containing protein [Leptodontidium sp. MPI-SDFR-AT-0119]|nr:major facilitator superfamily domain-containing protein [Leptodontidium sp. MPI-SDFR-AT-0119]
MAEKSADMAHEEYQIDLETRSKDSPIPTTLTAEDVFNRFDKQETRRIMRKIDFRLIPLLSVLYLMAFLDRSNIGNAKIAGMSEDLNLYGMRYNIALTVFFVPYALFEIPSNIVLKLLRPSIWISILCFCWGLVMTLMGLVNTYKGLVIARFFLGMAEAGFFPAATFLLTIWYQRYEVQRRMAVFYAAASLSGAFSGLLAYAIEKMDGLSGLAGWKWIFILEGLLPVIVSFSLYFILPDNPQTASFLTPEEREFVVNRIAYQTGVGSGNITNSDKMSKKYIIAGFSDWKVWMAIVPFLACSIGVYGFTATVPTVVRQLGYSSANAQLMTIPIYVAGMGTTLIAAWWSDRIQQRTPFIMGGFTFAVVGFIGELAIPHPKFPGVTYFFLFFIAIGLFSPFTCIVTLVANNSAPSSKRAVAMAVLISIGNLGGICGSNVYFAAQAPRYPAGFGTGLGMCTAGIIASFILRKAYQRENKQRDELIVAEGEDAIRARYSDQELMELGDKSPFFRYTV